MCYLNKDIPIETHASRDLPHWDQDGVIQYVTFRLADSLPRQRIEELKEIKTRFVHDNPKPWNDEVTRNYWKLTGTLEQQLMDNGYGSCVLKNFEVRKIVSDAIMYFNNSRYIVLAYVIMPNHVHLLIRLNEAEKLESCMQSIKSYSSKMINTRLNRVGRLWQKENFDRIVRNLKHLLYCVEYIKRNPDFLNKEEFELYIDYPSLAEFTHRQPG